MEHSGLLSWANSIRLTMAGDPGRQVFKDQVQTHGFMFLDDYLDNIVSGAKQDPLIELVKTPGRKKAIARKPKLMTSKLANTISSTLEEHSGTENLSPVVNFKAALDKIANQAVETDPRKAEKSKPESTHLNGEKIPRLPLVSIQPASVLPVPPPLAKLSLGLVTRSGKDHNDLSIIAEDDEPSERSRASTSGPHEAISSLSQPDPEVQEESYVPPRLSALVEDVSNDELNTTLRSSTSTFHSITLNSSGDQPDMIAPLQSASTSSEKPEATITRDSPDAIPARSPNDDYNPDFAMADIAEVVPGQESSEKPSAPSFPALPEPMPLRKSMRPPRDPSLNMVMLGSATPGVAIAGKRTSWLMKAREAKALEAPAKKPHIAPFHLDIGPSFSLPQGSKRKSEDMLGVSDIPPENEERQSKVIKTSEGASALRSSKGLQLSEKKQEKDSSSTNLPSALVIVEDVSQEGVLDRLKKTVEGFGVRVSKTMGKSVGGGAASALAEARAAAEARVAERDRKEEEMTMAMGMPTTANHVDTVSDMDITMSSTRHTEGRLSISDLFPSGGQVKEKHRIHEKPFQFTPSFTPTRAEETSTARESTSTTPPHSPPLQTNNKILSHVPVFNKPPPVFVPPLPALNRPSYIEGSSSVFTAPSATKDRLPPSSGMVSTPLTAHSTLESVQSDNIFDRDTIPAWMPSTQDTEYTSGYGSQSQGRSTQICDEDDSWPMDDKLAAGVQWTFGGSKEDSMTWSTLPSQSQRADTGPVAKTSPVIEEPSRMEIGQTSRQIPGAFDVDMDHELNEEEPTNRQDVELEDLILGSSKATLSVVESKIARSQSQMSMASSESSQSQGGFLGQASKLLSSALGTSKRKQPEVKKVLQMAAVAAKKQQEEADKKTARLKDMETRRQQALQRKAEEEKSKTLEEERRMKEVAERRKRERDDLTDKRALKPSGSKKEEEAQKKRKIETEKKQEIKKLGPTAPIGKSHLKIAIKPSANSSYAFGASGSTAVAESPSSLYKGKTPAVQQHIHDDEISHPSLLVQSQMAARAKAQIDAAKHAEPVVASECIELPDINSEYSDSDDEDRVRTFDPPEWAQSPELRQALEIQSTINPDDIFGAVRPLRMEEIFKTRTSRFRARSSSANWTGTDRLTMQEEKDYARRMGFK